jgi:hypothetical protein
VTEKPVRVWIRGRRALHGGGQLSLSRPRCTREGRAPWVGVCAASADRGPRTGLEVVHENLRLTDGIDFILSMVLLAAALELAEGLRTPLRNAASPSALCLLQLDFANDHAPFSLVTASISP